MNMALNNNKTNLLRDIVIIFFSIILAIIFVRTGVIINLLSISKEWEIIGSVIAGVFFISVFTVAPSAVVLVELAKTNSPWLVALFGGLGAVLGDLVLFAFVRDVLTEDLKEIIKYIKSKTIFHIFNFKRVKWLMPLLGAIIIASPLPDEIGIALLGLTKMKKKTFILLSFIFNFLGILAIGLLVS